MSHIKLKNLLSETHQQTAINEIGGAFPIMDMDGVIDAVMNLGLPAWTALPIAIGTVASTLFAAIGGYELSKTIKNCSSVTPCGSL